MPKPDAGREVDGGFVRYDGGPRDAEVATETDAAIPDPPDAGAVERADWYRDAIGYELFVRSFQDSDVDGIGDLQGLRGRLDDLHTLGVDLLWLMPLAKGSSWHGYEVTDYRAIDPAYGTFADLDQLLAAAHARGMHVILDHVTNHTSTEHPWFAAEHADWYVWSDVDPGWSQPWSNGSAWHARDGRWYYGVFSSHMPDLDYTNPALRAEMLDVAAFWLERGLDGFRLDGARYLVETGPGPGQQDTPETHAFWRELRVACTASRPSSFLVGEVWAETAIVAGYFGGAGAPELQMAFDFDSSYGITDSIRQENAGRASSTLAERLRRVPNWGTAATFLSNHDQPRIATSLANLGPGALRLAAALLLTWPGTPWIYYGEEIGMRNGDGNTDTRRPMQWSDDPNAGFSTAVPWAEPVSTARGESVAGQRDDPGSLYQLYRALIRLRRDHAALRRGLTRILPASGSASEPLALTRSVAGEALLVVYNFSTRPNDVVIPPEGTPLGRRFVDLAGGDVVERASDGEPLRLTLEPRGFRVLSASAGP